MLFPGNPGWDALLPLVVTVVHRPLEQRSLFGQFPAIPGCGLLLAIVVWVVPMGGGFVGAVPCESLLASAATLRAVDGPS